MRIQINENELPQDDPEDAKPWERDVKSGWHRARIRSAQIDKWKRGEDNILTVTFVVEEESGAWIDRKYDLESGQKAIVALARACALDPADFDSAYLVDCELLINVAHGKEKDSPPYHWLNVTSVKPIFEAAESPAQEELDGVPF